MEHFYGAGCCNSYPQNLSLAHGESFRDASARCYNETGTSIERGRDLTRNIAVELQLQRVGKGIKGAAERRMDFSSVYQQCSSSDHCWMWRGSFRSCATAASSSSSSSSSSSTSVCRQRLFSDNVRWQPRVSQEASSRLRRKIELHLLLSIDFLLGFDPEPRQSSSATSFKFWRVTELSKIRRDIEESDRHIYKRCEVMSFVGLAMDDTTDICGWCHKIEYQAMGMGGNQEFDYKCGLSPNTQTAARTELREDERTREQSLEQFKDWILKHPSIKRCRTDPVFLLRFLRTKKFSVPMAQDMLERYLTIRQLYPDWFQNLDINDPEIEAIIDSGYLVPLPEKDNHGRQVILSCAGRFDPYKYTSAQMARAHSLVVESLMDEEENQVHGYTHVNDESGLTMGHLSAWSLTDIRNMLRCIQNSTPMRHKETHFINIPGCATKIIEFAISLLSEKLKGRIHVHKSLQDLKEAINPKILPKEYGGEVPLSDMIASFKKTLRAKRDQLKALDDMYIEISPKERCAAVSEGLSGISGSFRKLEVD